MEILLSFIAGLGTLAGALIMVVFGQPNKKILSFLLGAAAGIMLSVVALDLLPASFHFGQLYSVLYGFWGGIILLILADWIITLFYRQSGENYTFLKMGYLIATGIALHDLPEGLAIAAGFSASAALGPALVLAIGLHNIPEGLAVAAPLRYGGMPAVKILSLTGLISVITPLGTYLGLTLIRSSSAFISVLLALAAGAMTYVVVSELWPKAKQLSFSSGCAGVVLGFFFMTGLTFLPH